MIDQSSESGFTLGCPLGNLALEVGQQPGKVTANFRQWREVVKGITSCCGKKRAR